VPEKEKPLQGGPVRGGDTPIIAKQGYNGNIPPAVIERFEREIRGLDFGGVSLVVTVRDGHPAYRIEKTVSIVTGA
jgi:hypothetical protein